MKKLLFLISIVLIFASCDKDGSRALQKYRIKEVQFYNDELVTSKVIYSYNGDKISAKVTQDLHDDIWVDRTKVAYTYSGNTVEVETFRYYSGVSSLSSKEFLVIEDNKLIKAEKYSTIVDSLVYTGTTEYEYTDGKPLSVKTYDRYDSLLFKHVCVYDKKKLVSLESYNYYIFGKETLDATQTISYDGKRITSFLSKRDNGIEFVNYSAADYFYEDKKISSIEYSVWNVDADKTTAICYYEYDKNNLLSYFRRIPNNDTQRFVYEKEEGNYDIVSPNFFNITHGLPSIMPMY